MDKAVTVPRRWHRLPVKDVAEALSVDPKLGLDPREAKKAIREEAMWALTSIAHRIGRTAFLEELENASLPESQAGKAREAIADRIYSYSADEAEEYFALFYERDGLNIPNLLYQQGTLH